MAGQPYGDIIIWAKVIGYVGFILLMAYYVITRVFKFDILTELKKGYDELTNPNNR